MNREELGLSLLLSVPVTVGVAGGVLKQTLGSQPLVAVGFGLFAGALVFTTVVAAIRTTSNHDGPGRLHRFVTDRLPEAREATRTDLLLGAGMGALVTVFLWYIPLSPLLGGAAAGFLQGGSREDAKTAGMLSGALVPVLVLLFAAGAFLVAGASVFGQFPFGPVIALIVSIVGIVYAVGFGAIGGWLGGMALEDERKWGAEI